MSRNRISLLGVSTILFLAFGTLHAVTSYDSNAPSAPTNVKAVGYTSYQPRVVVSWNQALDNIGVTRYNIYRNGTFLFSPSGVGVAYTDFNVTASTTYIYSVQAGDGDGNNGPQSDSVAILVAEGEVSKIVSAPSATSDSSTGTSIQQVTSTYTNTSINDTTPQVNHPENIGMTAYEDKLVITWKNPSGNTFRSVRVIKKDSSYPISATNGKVICDSLTLMQCIDKDVVSNKTYYYGVYAVDQSYMASKLILVSGSPLEKKEVVKEVVSTLQKNSAQTNSVVVASSPLVTTTGKTYFTKTLNVGSTGDEVVILQKLLNSKGFVIAKVGPGSPGNETATFGNATIRALQAYQCSKKIVCEGTPASTGYGTVGKTTRMYLNKE